MSRPARVRRRRPGPLVSVVAGLTVVVGLLVAAAPAAPAAPTAGAAGSGDAPGGRLVATVAAPRTPQVLDGRVYSVTQVGRTVVLGGSFTRVREDRSNRRFVRRGLVAFDAVTGRIKQRFHPDPVGDVRVVRPAPDGRSVYVGGEFTSIAGTPRAKLARIRVRDGGVVRSFRPGRVTGTVKDLVVTRGRLWIAGAFTHVGGRPHRALATLRPDTGRATGFMSLVLAGHHRRGATQVLKVAATPDGGRLVAVGNFATVGGAVRRELVVLDVGGRRAQVARFRTDFYSSACARRFDTTMRDVDVSPDGTYLVVATTGGYGGPRGSCDTVARFELAATGADAVPSWVDYTGGDTTYSVEVTGPAVYVGGHARWFNNPYASNAAGPGAVARRGIAALDPLNGLPLSWNPGRDRGVGVFDFLLTRQGLWVASDTTRIGRDQLRSRIALLPARGLPVAPTRAVRLPASVYLGGPDGLSRRRFDGRHAGAPQAAPDGGLRWGHVHGAFVVGPRLYVAHADGRLTVRSFDGTTYGPASTVYTADALVPLRGWVDDVRQATGMFFDSGRVYFTRTGSDRLYYRYFSPQSGVVGAERLVAPAVPAGVDLRQVRGMFVASGRFFWATPDGVLHAAGWQRGAVSGSVVGPSSPASAPDGGGTWNGRTLFVAPT
ncbi:hypothetical protein ABFT23_21795 [Nocardioides sp. C4-1]|uniref:hypothetical protein n=1 Tax=Nocardioides sp. C4-1 TaxID=3151851 RepID=UPI003264D444